MKRLILGVCAIALLACGGKSGGGSTTPTVAVQGYSATRWIPQNARYAVTARTFRDAHRSARDLLVTIASVRGISEEVLALGSKHMLGVDVMSPEGLAQIGIDVEGGFAFYADGPNPTIALHLASPPAFQKFLGSQPKLQPQSIMVDGIEVVTVPINNEVRVSWAVVDGWLLAHFISKPEPANEWLATSRHGGNGWWTTELAALKAPIIGVGDSARIGTDEADPAVLCVWQQVPEIKNGHFKLTMGSDDQHTSFSMAVDMGTFAQRIDSVALPVLEGWRSSTTQVPIAAQWNIDLAVGLAAIQPCMQTKGVDIRQFAQFGIRGGRGYLRTFDAEDKKPTGAVALDLTNKDFLNHALSEIPMRSTFERNRTFGPYAGKTLAIPMYITVDYVLNDQLALAAVGEGLLVQLVGKGGMQKGPLFELALQPQGLSTESWTALLQLIGINNAEAVAKALQKWRDARISARMDGTWLTFELAGTRQ